MPRVDDLTWVEYAEHLKEQPILFLPVGALEQHGPHLPMATDAIFATRMAEAVASELGGLVLPTIGYGYKSQARSGGGQTFPGTTSLDGASLTSMVRDIIRELARHGVTRLVVLDGHYENQWFLTEAIELAQRELALRGLSMTIVRTEYWDFCPTEVLHTVFEGQFPGYDLEHAALIETSMMLHWHPEKVRRDRIPDHAAAQFPPHDRYPQDGAGVPATGVLAPAGGASAEKGAMIIDATVSALAAALRETFYGSDEPPVT
jgi:creatinine amidohydrolase